MMNRATARRLLAMSSFILLAACKGGEKTPIAAEGPTVKGVTVESVKVAAIADLLEATGTVKARNSAQIAARIPGAVSSVLVREGERVRKGQLLMTIEAAESAAGSAGAEAGVIEAQRGLDEAIARRKLSDATFERFRTLYEAQAVTKQEFETREMEKNLAEQGVARAEARLVQAREGARALATVAGYRRITAPLAGIVSGKSVDVGMTVFPGMPLMTVEEEGGYRLEASVSESLLGKVKTGDRITLAIDEAAPNLSGRVAEVVPVVDPASRTFIVKIDLAGKGLRSGMFGRAFFPAGTKQGALVPATAIVTRSALTSVWVVDKEKRVRLRLVKVGRPVGDKVELLSGLADGEQVAVAGIELLVDGARLE
ncbi:MAG TPA: efflux RND transporter periplasmic adaptor subunit [Geobacterales bacterium]|nr:efflux RND transporter periplasmic adaptor subunit [Geobacterales bacterium]